MLHRGVRGLVERRAGIFMDDPSLFQVIDELVVCRSGPLQMRLSRSSWNFGGGPMVIRRR
jgi:hypothetical protein